MTARKTAIDPKLLEMLVCPLTKGELKYDAEAQELISEGAGLAYPIREGIPIMLVDEARRLDAPAKGPKGPPPARIWVRATGRPKSG